MNKYIDADKLREAIEDKGLDCSFALKMERLDILALIDELQQEQPETDLLEEAYMRGFAQGAKKERERMLEDIIKMRDTAEKRGLNFGAVCGFQIALDELEQMLTGKLARKEE